MNKNKYELTEETKAALNGVTLHRIRALRNFGDVKAGELGGWIETEINLSHVGICWVSDDTQVFGDARVFGNARVFDDARVSGNAQVHGNARMSGYAIVNKNS